MKGICLTIILTLLLTNISIGCDCIMTPLEYHLEKVDIILQVQAIQILDTEEERESYSIQSYPSDENIGYRAKLEILNNLKGNFIKGDSINISSAFSNCEFKYNVGEEYVLFLRKEGERYFIETCSYSERVTNERKNKKFHKKIIRKLRRGN